MTFLAWLAIAGSMLALALIVALGISRGQSNAAIFGWRDGQSHAVGGPGLTYAGRAGFVLAAVELAAIALVAWLSCRRRPAWRPWRRLALLLLVAWSALWFVGAARQLAGTREPDAVLYTTSMALFVVAAGLRARWRWTI